MKSRIVMLLLAALPFLASAALTVDPVFSSHAVLQRDVPIAFWGTADAKSEIKVAFAGKEVKVNADDKGNWRAEFPAMKANSTPQKCVVSCKGAQVSLDDLLIGDVWLCSGQSNMEMPIGKKYVQNWSMKDCEQVVAAANDLLLRYVKQKNVSSISNRLKAQYGLGRGWMATSSDVAANFSATPYFFGKNLREQLDIPIGLVNSCWSGTRIEPWISREGYEAAGLDKEAAIIRKYDMTPAQWKEYYEKEKQRYPREIAEYMKIVNEAGAAQREACKKYAEKDFDDSKWKLFKFNYDKRTQIRWYRTHFKLKPEMRGKEVVIETVGKGADEIEYFLNGKPVCSWKAQDPENKKRFKMTFKPEDFDQEGDNVLVARTVHLYDLRGEIGWIWKVYGKHCELMWNTKIISGESKIGIWKWLEGIEFVYDWEAAGVKRPDFYDDMYKSPQCPAVNYNGMIDPWTKLPIKGVIWYQGNSNAGEERYYKLHKALIADWRSKWKNPKMPFLIVQLEGCREKDWEKVPPSDAKMAQVRDVQMQMLKIPYVGLATAIDIGDPVDIHPTNKQELGRRLALEALRVAYGRKVASSGPQFKSAESKNGVMVVNFTHVEKGLTTSDGKEPGAFAIAGADKKFVWAKAKITGKSTVEVWSPEIVEPKYVRYAYVNYRGDCNLQNSEHLPAFPFRSDAVDYKD